MWSDLVVEPNASLILIFDIQTHPSSHRRRKVKRVPLSKLLSFKDTPVIKVFEVYEQFAALRDLDPSERRDAINVDIYVSAWNAYHQYRLE